MVVVSVSVVVVEPVVQVVVYVLVVYEEADEEVLALEEVDVEETVEVEAV